MMKAIFSFFLVFLTGGFSLSAAVVPAPAAQINVLRNVSLQLSVYQQGVTNSAGSKVADKVSAFTTKNFIQAVGAATSQNFGTTAKLVLSQVYSNVVLSTGSDVFTNSTTNTLVLGANEYLKIGGAQILLPTNGLVIVASNNVFISGFSGTLNNNQVIVAQYSGPDISTNTFNNSAGYVTTFTFSSGVGVTNVTMVNEQELSSGSTTSAYTNITNSVDILYGTANALYPVDNYISFSTNSAEIVVQTGVGLNTNNPSTVSNLTSQSGFSLQGLEIAYPGPTNLSLSLQGFVSQSLKVDLLYAHGTNRLAEDIFGSTATWAAIGSGYIGGTLGGDSTDAVYIPLLDNYLSNAAPVVVQGKVSITFLKNLAQ